MTRDRIIFLTLYLVTLAWLLTYNLTHPPVNDGVKEYASYLLNIDNGWEYRRTLVNSSLLTTWVPAMFQRLTSLDAMIVFRVTPPLFYALLPAFTYAIARKYLPDTRFAVIAPLLVMASSYILFFPDIGRVGVAIAMFAGTIWALLNNKLIWALLFSLLIVFSHYGTSLICLGLVFSCLVVYGVFKRKMLFKYLTVFCVLAVSIGIWHFGIARYSGFIMLTYGIQHNMPAMTGDTIGAEGHGDMDWFSLESREPAVKQSLVGVFNGTIPERIEVISNWLVVILVTLGLYALMKSNRDIIFKTMGLSLWLLIAFTVLVPWLSTFYNGMRVFFTSLPVLAVLFPVGASMISKWNGIKTIVISVIVLVLFAVSTSGLIYRPFDMEKTLPVVVTLEDL